MPLILVDALPEGQAIINTDHVIVARTVNGKTVIHLREGHFVEVPHESAAKLFNDMGDCVPIPSGS